VNIFLQTTNLALDGCGGGVTERMTWNGHTCPSTGCGPNVAALWREKQTRKKHFFVFHLFHLLTLTFYPFFFSMKIDVVNESGEHICYVEVSPSDTIWTLKCKLHREALKRPSSERAEGGAIIPPPDDQTLAIHPHGSELSQCEKTLEFYDLHEGSTVHCELKWGRFPQEMNFRKCVDVFRKVERNELTLSMEDDDVTSSMAVCAYHACCHMHEVTVLDLQCCELGDEGAIRIAEGLEKNTSLIRLDLRGVFPPPSFFIHCCICHSFIS
jgi:hypothetical protein